MSEDLKLYTVNEAATILRLHRKTVYSLIKSGDLESIKIRGRRLITASAIAKLIEDSKAHSGKGEGG